MAATDSIKKDEDPNLSFIKEELQKSFPDALVFFVKADHITDVKKLHEDNIISEKSFLELENTISYSDYKSGGFLRPMGPDEGIIDKNFSVLVYPSWDSVSELNGFLSRAINEEYVPYHFGKICTKTDTAVTLCHEFAHAIQHTKHDPFKKSNESLNETNMFEKQADFFAGFCMSKFYEKNIKDHLIIFEMSRKILPFRFEEDFSGSHATGPSLLDGFNFGNKNPHLNLQDGFSEAEKYSKERTINEKEFLSYMGESKLNLAPVIDQYKTNQNKSIFSEIEKAILPAIILSHNKDIPKDFEKILKDSVINEMKLYELSHERTIKNIVKGFSEFFPELKNELNEIQNILKENQVYIRDIKMSKFLEKITDTVDLDQYSYGFLIDNTNYLKKANVTFNARKKHFTMYEKEQTKSHKRDEVVI